jgi:hypothetical protein
MGWDTGNSEFGFGSNVGILNDIITFYEYGNVKVGNLLGNVYGQTLTATGNIVASNVSVTGQLNGTLLGGTLTTSIQPNITSVGTLTSLVVTGNISSGNLSTGNITLAAGAILSGDGSGLTELNASNISSGTLSVAHGGTGLTVPGIAGQMLTSNGSSWISDYGIILSNLTLYVATTGNDTTGDGLTPGTAWATPHRAMAWLRDRTIGDGVTVTITVAAGDYIFTTTLNLNHPQGVQIFINGTGTTGTRPVGAALQGGATAVRGNTVVTEAYNNALLVAYYNTRWQFNDCIGLECTLGGGVTVNTVLIRGNANVSFAGVVCGNFNISDRIRAGSINLGNTVAVHNFGSAGIQSQFCGSISAINITVTNCGGTGITANFGGNISAVNSTSSNNGFSGIQVYLGGTLQADGSMASNNARWGVFCQFGGVINSPNLTATNNTFDGVRIDWGGTIICTGSTINNNGSSGIQVNYGGSIRAQNSIVTNNVQNGIWANNGGDIQAIGVTVTGNGGVADIYATGSGFIGYRAGTAGTFSPALGTVGNGNALIQAV